MEKQHECLLHVKGDAAALNTFDKVFRSGLGPQWADRPSAGFPRYSLHALFPVPEDIQRRGYQLAGRQWCLDYWDASDDLCQMQVKRLLGERHYRFFTPSDVPDNVILRASHDYPLVQLCLISLGEDGGLQQRKYHAGYYEGQFSPRGIAAFANIRTEMGFAA